MIWQNVNELSSLPAIFLGAWLPYVVVSLVTVAHGPEAVSPLIITLLAILAKCSCVITPLIYMATNDQFREQFGVLMCGRRIITSPSRTPSLHSIIDNSGDLVTYTIRIASPSERIPGSGNHIALTSFPGSPDKIVMKPMVNASYRSDSPGENESWDAGREDSLLRQEITSRRCFGTFQQELAGVHENCSQFDYYESSQRSPELGPTCSLEALANDSDYTPYWWLFLCFLTTFEKTF